MTDFFANHIGELTFPGNRSSTSTRYRACQEGAYWAIKAHTTTSSDAPAIISLPTGGGKTAVMMLSAFEYTASRVLIIVPSDSLRSQVDERFTDLVGLVKANAYDGETDELVVKSHTGRFNAESEWDVYSDADVVISTPNSISDVYSNDDEADLVLPPDGFFDLLLVDEAHHTPAPGWGAILESFADIPQLLFTATPFRREDEPIPGELIYHYPIIDAKDEGIYNEVRLHPVDESDQGLIEAAEDKLDSLQASNDSATLLARVSKIDAANELASSYNEETSLTVQAVHSETENNQETVGKLRDGDIDGVVVVNKFIEGLDVENLQLAVFHAPPKSFPRMVQIMGRLARSPADGKPATILASEDDIENGGMSQAVRQLYRDDTGWATVAEDVIAEYISTDRTDSPTGVPSLDAVSPTNIRPYKTVSVYSIADTVVEPFATTRASTFDPTDPQLGSVFSPTDSVWGCITQTQESPSWGTDTILQSETYNLHLYCAPDGHELLFEYTSDTGAAQTIRETIIRDATAAPQITGKRLSKAMQSLSAPKFKAAGMNNVQVPSGTQPEHKLLTGNDVQGAVYHSDARRYTHGHIFASFEADREAVTNGGDDDAASTGDTRGISTTTGSIWSNSKADLTGFQQWCSTLAKKLSTDRTPAIQNFGSMHHGEPVDTFDSAPFFVVPYPALYSEKLEARPSGTDEWHDVDIALDLAETDNTPPSSVAVEVSIPPVTTDIACTCSVDDNQWAGDICDYQFRLPDVQAHAMLSGDAFLSQYPPRFQLDSTTAVMGGNKYTGETNLDEFDPSELAMPLQPDWSSYIAEDANEKPEWWTCKHLNSDADLAAIWEQTSTESVFAAMVEILTSAYGEDDYVLFCGDYGDEIADFIDFRMDDKEISFYHCKSSDSPGIQVKYIKDIYHQTIRSLRHTFDRELVETVASDHEGSVQSHIVHGEETFKDINTNFVPTEWTYTICGVHPGLILDFDPEANNENVGRLLSELVEQVERYNVDFGMIGAGDGWS